MPVKTKKAKTPVKELTGVQDLYHFLYKACDILRKFVEHESFKDYITPLLYYKRLSDVWDEEYEAALAESGNDEEYARLPEQHRFVIPKECHWEEVRERPENLGAAIVEALLMIEQANPDTLYGVLSVFPTDNFRDKNKLSDEVVRNLIEHLSSRKLGNKDYPADLMGDAYEILLKSFADESKAKAGEFYTPRSVVKLLVRILDPQPGERVYDPACGSGGMLIEAVHHMQNSKLCLGQIFGQEKNVKNAAIAKMNLFLHGASDFCIRQGRDRQSPVFAQGVEPDDVEQRPLRAEHLGNAAAGLWRLRLASAHGEIHAARAREDGGCAAAGRAVPRKRGGRDPPQDG